jgi:hypothetical protein
VQHSKGGPSNCREAIEAPPLQLARRGPANSEQGRHAVETTHPGADLALETKPLNIHSPLSCELNSGTFLPIHQGHNINPIQSQRHPSWPPPAHHAILLSEQNTLDPCSDQTSSSSSVMPLLKVLLRRTLCLQSSRGLSETSSRSSWIVASNL